MARLIKCSECGIYLGEIRDARLQKGIQYTCSKCAEGRKNITSDFVDGLMKYRKKGLFRNDN